MYFNIDPKFKEYFQNLKQVFLYITDECNLRCIHCLYKPNLTFHLKEKEIDLKTALSLIYDFRKMGASKLTIMGGEPTLYGTLEEHKPLLKVISEAKKTGYEYLRIDTNGIFEKSLLLKEDFKNLDEITFSLDGHTPKINDSIRGKGVFNKCVQNIKRAIELGYKVDITSCVHRGNIGRDKNGNLLLHELIQFVTSLGVNRINFHPLFKMGVPRDTWIGKVDVSPEEWLNIQVAIGKNVKSGEYKIPVRIPQRFITRKEFERNLKYYTYCPAKMGERVLVHPNGIIRICALMIGTPYGVAHFYNNKIVWDESLTNELRSHELNLFTPCSNQRKNFGNLLPLCISFKSEQEEFIWKEKLAWERKRQIQEEENVNVI